MIGFPQHRLWPLFNEPWLSSEIRVVLDQAKSEATKLAAGQVAPLHLLLALASGSPATNSERARLTGHILHDLGVTRESLAQAIAKSEEPPEV